MPVQLKAYKVKPVKKGYSIFRPDGSAVNEAVFPTEAAATAYLDRLVSMGYCKK